MQKYTLLSILGAGAIALAATSCSNDDMPAPVSGEGVSFEVKLPEGLSTRAFSDGLLAKNLKVAVYEADGTTPVISNFPGGTNASSITITPMSDLTYRVTVPLVKGEDYNFIFWAQSYADDDTANPYTIDTATKSLTVDYSKMTMNTEATDAFYAYYELPSTASGTQTVILKRPFAQINVGTDDYSAYLAAGGATIENTALTFTNLATSFDFVTSKASGEATSVAYPAAALPATTEVFPAGNGMQYLAMAYVLVGDQTNDKAQINTVALMLNGQTTAFASYDNIPAQRNFRTNIFGSLLTRTSDFLVTIDPAFETPDYNITSTWDGTSSTTPKVDADGNYVINTASDLAGLFAMVNGGDNLSGKTVKLNSEIDLGGSSAWTPIGTASKPFSGEFDGQGNKVKGNVKALFGSVENANIHDVNVEASSAQYSALIQATNGNTTLKNITVTGSVKGSNPLEKYGAAGLVSYVPEGTLTVESCNNYATVTDASYCAGGIVGRTAAPVTLKNCNNFGAITSTRYDGAKAAGMIGMPAADATLDGCTNYGNITVTTNQGGCAGAGMIGWDNSGFTMTNCANKGDISVTASNINGIVLAGGLVGGSGWNNGGVVIDKCSNTGSVKVIGNSLASGVSPTYDKGLYAGGIVACETYGTVSVTNTNNTGAVSAESPAGGALQYVSSLCGGLGWLTDMTMTGCNAGGTVTGNNNPVLSAYYSLCGPDATKKTMSGNTNSTSYPDTAK